MTTATTKGARDHARSQASQITDTMPVLPASNWPWAPDDVDPLTLTWAETIPGGRYASKVLSRGTRLRLTDVTGSACVSVVLLRADAPWERLNVADTVKVPWQAYLGTGHPLLSDQGRVLATIVADSSGHHDTFCGTTTLTANTAKYGAGELYSASPAGRELFTLAAAKHGLASRDIGPSVSLFHGIRAEADGTLHSAGTAGPGAAVDLLIHLPVIALLVNTAHPLDPSDTFDTGPVQVLAWSALDELVDLPNKDPEYQRAVLNTEDAWAAAQNGDSL
ncbi:urea amidolyase associated protein UAAP1 [Mycobacterium sp. D16R24]|uniref:urea amidolyase associated protein UAAP1 n=1 Tax=Mycobacterium sp. D16R24 TaxID=1855656 RepID=UPI00099422FD|nr:urea amidolyase associated protein UAAP1 [Mycobacterium sp. D16R24]